MDISSLQHATYSLTSYVTLNHLLFFVLYDS